MRGSSIEEGEGQAGSGRRGVVVLSEFKIPCNKTGFTEVAAVRYAWKCCLAALVLLPACFGLSAFAQNYAVNWVAFQGGGGESEAAWGTPYYLKSTISQSQGSPSSSGADFTLAGHIFAQNTATITIPQPALALTLNPDGSVTVSWPVLSTGYLVQQSSTLAPGSWATAPYSINHNGVIRWFTVQPATSRMFYRLQKP